MYHGHKKKSRAFTQYQIDMTRPRYAYLRSFCLSDITLVVEPVRLMPMSNVVKPLSQRAIWDRLCCNCNASQVLWTHWLSLGLNYPKSTSGCRRVLGIDCPQSLKLQLSCCRRPTWRSNAICQYMCQHHKQHLVQPSYLSSINCNTTSEVHCTMDWDSWTCRTGKWGTRSQGWTSQD